MTAPGGSFGESANDDKADSSGVGGEAGKQPDHAAPWEPPASPPPAESAQPEYPPPGYSPDYASGYPPPYPPPVPPPAGYEPPPVYGGPSYPPAPAPYGGPPPVYGPPGHPGGYYPTPDYQGGYAPAGSSRPGTNALAIASLIASFTGLLCCVGSIVGMVLGAIALDQIKRTRQDGFGLAVAGIVIGIATLVVTLVIVLFAVDTGVLRSH